MGRREVRRDHRSSSSVMSTEDRSERRENMQDTADTETGDDGSETSSLDSRRLLSGDKRPSHTGESGSMPGPLQLAGPVEVKKHQHKHNLKHRYEVMETLGKGTYGKVKRAVERTTRKTVAIKSIRKESITDDLDRIHIQREIEITSALKHPYIIRFHEVFESRDKIVIVMEYASRGELYDYVHERRRLVETETRDIFRQITSAVHYCHTNGVVHRDLKLENILLDQDLNVKGAARRAMQQRLHRRQYRVAGPNSLWHIDGNHKLILHHLSYFNHHLSSFNHHLRSFNHHLSSFNHHLSSFNHHLSSFNQHHHLSSFNHHHLSSFNHHHHLSSFNHHHLNSSNHHHLSSFNHHHLNSSNHHHLNSSNHHHLNSSNHHHLSSFNHHLSSFNHHHHHHLNSSNHHQPNSSNHLSSLNHHLSSFNHHLSSFQSLDRCSLHKS